MGRRRGRGRGREGEGNGTLYMYRVSLKELYSDNFDLFATRKCKSDQFVHIGLTCSVLAVICFLVD